MSELKNESESAAAANRRGTPLQTSPQVLLAKANELWKADPTSNHRKVITLLFQYANKFPHSPAGEEAALKILEGTIKKLEFTTLIESTKSQMASVCMEFPPPCGSKLSASITTGNLRSMTQDYAVLLQTAREIGAKNLTFADISVPNVAEQLLSLLKQATSHPRSFEYVQKALADPELQPGLKALVDWWYANRESHNLPRAVRVALAVATNPHDPELSAQILRPALEAANQPTDRLSNSPTFSFIVARQLGRWAEGTSPLAFSEEVHSGPPQVSVPGQTLLTEQLSPLLDRLENGLALDSNIFREQIAPNFERLGVKQRYHILRSSTLAQLRDIPSAQLAAVRDHYIGKQSPVKGLISILKCREMGLDCPLHETRFLYQKMSDIGFFKTLKILEAILQDNHAIAAEYGSRMLAHYCIVAVSKGDYKSARNAYEVARDCGIAIPLEATFYCVNREQIEGSRVLNF